MLGSMTCRSQGQEARFPSRLLSEDGAREICPRIVWVTRSFLDYRVPVYAALDELVCGDLYLLFSSDYVPERVQKKATQALGERAIALRGEWGVGAEDTHFLANRNVSIRYQPGLMRQIRALRPDVMVCDGFFKWTLPALLYRVVQRTPLVVCYERWAHTERHAQWYRRIYRRLALKATDAVCCNGSLSLEYTQSLGFPGERMTTGHMASETTGLGRAAADLPVGTRSQLRADLHVQGVALLFVGQLIPRKGVAELLQAWSAFERLHPQGATLLLVGEGPEGASLRSRMEDLRLKNVRFVGAVDYDELPAYYTAADALIMPTLEDNWSLVVPEAMACGLPVLCSKYNGCWPELVQEECNGWVFDPLSSVDTVRCLVACLAHHDSLVGMGRESLRIIQRHTPQKAAEAILEACQIALARRGWSADQGVLRRQERRCVVRSDLPGQPPGPSTP